VVSSRHAWITHFPGCCWGIDSVAAFLTREYLPFRFDAGPHEPTFDLTGERQ